MSAQNAELTTDLMKQTEAFAALQEKSEADLLKMNEGNQNAEDELNRLRDLLAKTEGELERKNNDFLALLSEQDTSKK